MTEVKGAKELRRKLLSMPEKVQKKVLRNAGTLAINPMVQEAKRSAPVSDRDTLRRTYTGKLIAPGFAKRSIAKKVKLYQGGRFVKAMVGVKPEAYYILQFVERGTSRQAKQPWLEPAFRKTRGAVLSRFSATMKKKILESARLKR
jgi:HK97 gp10 family phage protein